MERVNTISGKTALELEEEILKVLGDGAFLLIWGTEGEDGKVAKMAVLSNMEGDSRLHAVSSYLQEEIKGNHSSMLADLFEVSALGALASILKDRAAALAANLGRGGGVPVSGGKGDAN